VLLQGKATDVWAPCPAFGGFPNAWRFRLLIQLNTKKRLILRLPSCRQFADIDRLRGIDTRCKWTDTRRVVRNRAFVWHTRDRFGGDSRLPAERDWVWLYRLSGEVKHRERLHAQEIGLLHIVGGDDLVFYLRLSMVRRAGREQAIFTAIWIPSIFGFGLYFKLAVLLGRKA
jgi:hypothetical protein